ncbi:YncE family protein [Nonomuraea glycinis]|uniref:YncE family protein n=1 Tax=Nonomuraea glycinis TaxID=2047744 RepID=UPI0033AEDA83
MRLRWMTSMLGAAAVAVASCGAPPAPMVAVPESASPLRSPPRQGHAQAPARETPMDVYAHDRPGMLSPKVRNVPPRVYVPNSESDTVDVIDPRTFRVVRRFRVGDLPQHVVPSWDLKTLWVNENRGNRLTPIDPVTGRPGKPVSVDDPYNLYFTPDGSYALVMAERNNRLDFRDPHTMRLVRSLPLPCRGVNHGDFTADGSVFLASCEFSGQLVAIDWKRPRVRKVIGVGAGNMPQDVKLSPDGRVFYVADMMADGTWIIDAATFQRVGFLRTGKGAHGLYVSRDSRSLYVSNRHEGTVSVVSLARRKVVDRWRIPGGGSPDMGGVSADGKQLWLSGRYHGVVYVFNTETGKLQRTIKVGQGPHGLCFYPQPGRYSLGHTGVFR